MMRTAFYLLSPHIMVYINNVVGFANSLESKKKRFNKTEIKKTKQKKGKTTTHNINIVSEMIFPWHSSFHSTLIRSSMRFVCLKVSNLWKSCDMGFRLTDWRYILIEMNWFWRVYLLNLHEICRSNNSGAQLKIYFLQMDLKIK